MNFINIKMYYLKNNDYHLLIQSQNQIFRNLRLINIYISLIHLNL